MSQPLSAKLRHLSYSDCVINSDNCCKGRATVQLSPPYRKQRGRVYDNTTRPFNRNPSHNTTLNHRSFCFSPLPVLSALRWLLDPQEAQSCTPGQGTSTRVI